MIFSYVTVQNFFSIAEPITWEIKDKGLVCITGWNKDSRAADSNGSGKSTLFEALLWALWGKTIRGQSGDAVVNRRIGKDCRVEVGLEHEGEEYTVFRYRKHKTGKNSLEFFGPEGDLTQGTTSLTQKKLDSFLGIDFDTFINGPMMPQGSFKRFSAMSDAEQKAIFDQALRTGVLQHAQNEVKDRLARAYQALSKASAEAYTVESSITRQTAARERYEDEKAQWAQKKSLELAKLANELTEVVVQQEKLWEQSRAVDFDAAIESAKKKVNDASRQKTKAEEIWSTRRQEIKEHIAQFKGTLRVQNDLAIEINKRISEFKSMTGMSCPTCEQAIPESHVDECVLELEEQLKEARERGNDCVKKIKGWVEALEDEQSLAHERVDELEKAIESHQAAYLEVVSEASQATAWVNELAALNRQEATLRKHYREKRSEPFPYDEMIEDAIKEIHRLQKELMIKNSALRGKEIEIEHLAFWKHGFSNKGLKSYILDSVTPFLNDKANFYAQALTGGDITIEFKTQTTLRSGEVREKFSVEVTNKNGADTYAGNSGGEKGRADLSISFSLSDLVASRARQAYPQRFLDEPFEGLDEAGVEAVMELLSEMAADAGSVFVVTHNDAMKGMFPNTITVVKENAKTTVV